MISATTTPSIVAFDKDGKKLVGELAKRQQSKHQKFHHLSQKPLPFDHKHFLNHRQEQQLLVH